MIDSACLAQVSRRSSTVLFVASLASFGFVQQQFFPTSTRTELFLEMRLPEGTAIGVTDAAAQEGRALLRRRRMATYTPYVGQGAARFGSASTRCCRTRTSRRSSS